MSKTLQNQADFYSSHGAEDLKRRIVQYWRDQGYRGIVVDKYQHSDFPDSWFLRSNIGANGFPPRQAVVA